MPFALAKNLFFAKKLKFFLPHLQSPLYMDVQGRDDEGFTNNLHRITPSWKTAPLNPQKSPTFRGVDELPLEVTRVTF